MKFFNKSDFKKCLINCIGDVIAVLICTVANWIATSYFINKEYNIAAFFLLVFVAYFILYCGARRTETKKRLWDIVEILFLVGIVCLFLRLVDLDFDVTKVSLVPLLR